MGLKEETEMWYHFPRKYSELQSKKNFVVYYKIYKGLKKMRCDDCQYYVYDDDYQEYVCDMDMDEDDYARIMLQSSKECPYWRNGDEYAVVRHQM